MDVIVSETCKSIIDFFTAAPTRISIFLLIIANFVCNNLFLFQLKYYADDFFLYVYPQSPFLSVSYTLLESQRPLTYSLHVLLSRVAYSPLVFHVLAFVVTTIGLILIYYIFKKIFNDFGHGEELYPFLGAMIFCVLFNKDEVTAWPTLSNGLVRIAAIIAIFLYLNKEKNYYLVLSCLAYFISLLSSEYAVALPGILLVYDYFLGKDWKRSLYFAVPLAAYLAIRLTNWFGFGWVLYSHEVEIGKLESIINAFQYPIMIITDLYKYFIDSLYGYAQMGVPLIVVIVIINAVLLFIIYRYIKNLSGEKENSLDYKLPCLAIVIIIAFLSPFMIGGYTELPARAYYLTDIGIALLFVTILMAFQKCVDIRKIVFVFIIFGIFINQGLFFNWVVEGNTIDRVDQYIQEHGEEIARYNYFYFKPESFLNDLPHEEGIKDFFLYPTFQELRRIAGLPNETAVSIPKNTRNFNYASYYNVRGLSYNALKSMIDAQKGTNFTLIYKMNWPKNRVIPVNITKERITYKRMGNGEISSVNRDEVFEINYTSVFASEKTVTG